METSTPEVKDTKSITQMMKEMRASTARPSEKKEKPIEIGEDFGYIVDEEPQPTPSKPSAGKGKSPQKEGSNPNPGTTWPFSMTEQEAGQAIEAMLVNRASVRAFQDYFWPPHDGERPKSRKGMMQVVRMIAQHADPEVTKLWRGNAQKWLFITTEEKLDEGLIDHLEDPIQKKEKAKAGNSQAPAAQQVERNPVFNTVNSIQGNGVSPLVTVFKEMSEEEVRAMIAMTDRLAYIVPSPIKAVNSKGQKEKEQHLTKMKGEGATRKALAGTVRRRFDAKANVDEIIEYCTNPATMGAIVNSRLPNASTMYGFFLRSIAEASPVKEGSLNWGWADLVKYFCTYHEELVNEMIAEGLNSLAQGIVKDGCWGPFIWRTQTEILLNVQYDLAKKLRDANLFKLGGANQIVVPQNLDIINPLVNIALPGAECVTYMSPQQYQRRVNLGIPWVKYGAKPIKLGRELTNVEAAKVCNKSANEYRAFLKAQRAPRQTRGRTPRAQGKNQSSVKVDEW